MSGMNACWCWFKGLEVASLCAFGAAVSQTLASYTDCASAQITPDGTLPNNSRVRTSGIASLIEEGIQTKSTEPSRAQTLDILKLPNINFPVRAQILPSQDVQPPSPKPLSTPSPPPLLPPPSDLLRPSKPAPTQDEPFPEVPQTFTVKRFEVVGSTVFSSEKLAQVLEKFTNKPITFAGLLQTRSAITQLYIEKGYITSFAYIPEQALSKGVVKIRVVEGRLEDIQVSGIEQLNPNYVRSRLALATSPPLNRERLLEALQLLQLNPLIKNLSAELSTGFRPGTSVLAIRVKEAPSSNIQAALDNGRSPSVGSFRRQLQLNEANLLGLGDGLSLAYANTDGSNAWDVSYILPLNPRNGTLTFSYSATSNNQIERPFNILDIESASRYYELTFRQPIVQTPTQEFALGLTASRRESDISSLLQREGLPASELSPGADEQGRTRISALRFFQEWTSRNSREVIAARSGFSLGIDAFNTTINANPPDSRFFAWRGQAQWVRLLAPDTLLLVRGDVQLASTSLLASELFSLGGIKTVRGYRQNFLLPDNGVLATAELQYPILRFPQWQGVLQLVPFVDVGRGWNSSGRENLDVNTRFSVVDVGKGLNSSGRENLDVKTLASVGLGLQLRLGKEFAARLDWGIPLVSVDSRERTWQENGLYFSICMNCTLAQPSFGIFASDRGAEAGIEASKFFQSFDASKQIDTSCNPGSKQQASSFIITGRGGLPPNPRTEPLTPDAVQVDWVTLKPSIINRSSPPVTSKPPTTATPELIVEASGWVLNEKGEVVLTANPPTVTPHSPWLTPASCHAS